MMSSFDPNEYMASGRLKDGLAKCNKLLKKNPDNVTLLTTKAGFLREMKKDDEAQAIIKSLMNSPKFPKDAKSIRSFERFLSADLQNSSPQWPLTLGSDVNALWTSAGAGIAKQDAIDLCRARFDDAVEECRWIDVGYALSTWRKLDPNNKTLRLLHSAVYQLIAENIATEPKTAMMNGMLALRTLDQSTDANPSEPELMLYCQVCTRQNKLRNIADRLKPIVESPQCTWAVLREYRKAATTLGDWEDVKRIMSNFLAPKDSSELEDATSLRAMIRNDWASWQAYLQAHHSLGGSIDTISLPLDHSRFTALANLWFLNTGKQADLLLSACINHWCNHMADAFCFDDLKEPLLSLSVARQLHFREQCLEGAKVQYKATDNSTQYQKWLNAEINALRFEYLLTIGQNKNVDSNNIRAFVSVALRLHDLQKSSVPTTLATLLCAALVRWHEVDPLGGHLLEATSIIESYARDDDYQAKVLLVYLYTELGLYPQAVLYYEELSIKELQHETFSHALLPRISIGRPFPGNSLKKPAYSEAAELLNHAVAMYPNNRAKLATFSKSLINTNRPDMLLELQDLNKTLGKSISFRVAVLEDRRVRRFTDRPQDRIRQPDFLEAWQENLRDSRDYRTTANVDAGDEFIDSSFLNVRSAPNTKWILYNLWIEETWSLLQDTDPIVRSFVLGDIKIINTIDDDPSLTNMENTLVPAWKCLGILTVFGRYAVVKQKIDPMFTTTLDYLVNSEIPALPMSQILDVETDPAGPPTATLIQSIYLMFDFLRALNLFLKTFSNQKETQSVLPKSKALSLLSLVQDLFDKLHNYAKQQRAYLDINTISEALSRSIVAEHVDVADHAKLVLDSAIDTWDGVLKVKLQAPVYTRR